MQQIRGPRARANRTRIVAAAAVIAVLAGVALGERDRAESRAIGRLRAIVSAQQAYAALHDGRFTSLECLANPACAAPVGDRRVMLDPALAVLGAADGYAFLLDSMAVADALAPPAFGGPSLRRFAVAARPLEPARHGRAFCADDSGVIFVTKGGALPQVAGGRCIDRSTPLE